MNQKCVQLSRQVAMLEDRLHRLRHPQPPRPQPPDPEGEDGKTALEAALEAQIQHLVQEMDDAGCFPAPPPTPHVVGTLTGTLTLWSDNSAASGPASGSITCDLVFTQFMGEWDIHIFTFSAMLSFQDMEIDVELQPGKPGETAPVIGGTFTPSPAGGIVSLIMPLQITLVNHALSLNLNDLRLSTQASIALPAPNKGTVPGQDIDNAGSLTLVGQGQGSVPVEVYAQITGTLTNWPDK